MLLSTINSFFSVVMRHFSLVNPSKAFSGFSISRYRQSLCHLRLTWVASSVSCHSCQYTYTVFLAMPICFAIVVGVRSVFSMRSIVCSLRACLLSLAGVVVTLCNFSGNPNALSIVIVVVIVCTLVVVY